MSEGISLALVAGSFALAGSVITGWFTYKASDSQKETDRYKRRLKRTYRDIASFYRLEEKYTNALASHEKTAESWKREIRKALRDENYPSPSDDATAQQAEKYLRDLD